MKTVKNSRFNVIFVIIMIIFMAMPINAYANEFKDAIKTGAVHDNGNTDAEVITDETTPLSRRDHTWSVFNLTSALVSFVAGIYMLFRKNDKDKPNYIQKKAVRVMTVTLGFLSPIMFALSEDMSTRMVIFDRWSLMMTVIMLISATLVLIHHRISDSQELSGNK